MNQTIEKNFRYHAPTLANVEAHARIRDAARDFAQLIDDLVPQNAGREKATATTHVESAMMWACAGIVRHSKVDAATVPVSDWRCDNCGWRGTSLSIAEAPQRHAAYNQAEKMLCSGNLKRNDTQSL